MTQRQRTAKTGRRGCSRATSKWARNRVTRSRRLDIDASRAADRGEAALSGWNKKQAQPRPLVAGVQMARPRCNRTKPRARGW